MVSSLLCRLQHSGVLRFLLWNLRIFFACSTWVANCLSCWGPDKHTTASISNSIFHRAISVYMCQSACRYPPKTSSESGPSVVQQGADQVPPGRWWFWDLPGSSLYYRRGFLHCFVDPEYLYVFFWGPWPNGWGSAFSAFLWLEQPAFCGADDQVVSRSSPSGKECQMVFGVPVCSLLMSLMGIVFMAQTMARSAKFRILSSLLSLAFVAVAQEVVAHSMKRWTAPV